MFDKKEELHQTQNAGDYSTQYQAARDIIINNPAQTDIKLEVMRALVKKYNEEKQSQTNTEFSGYIKKLEKFTTLVEGDLADLSQKLTDGGYQSDIDWALELKEQYTKMLQENKFSLATQHIHAYLLAWIIVLFKQFVLQAIRAGSSQSEVKDVINTKVIAQVESIIGGENNVLEIYSDDINAMIYYLTGNCHLIWK